MRARETLKAVHSAAERTVRRPHRSMVLSAALRAGMPGLLEKPLRFYVWPRLDQEDRRRVELVERRRSELGAQTVREARTAMGREFTIGRFAQETSASPEKATVLYLLAKESRAQTIIELGSCVGISGSYLASANPQRMVSIEGSPELSAVASESIRQVKPDAEVLTGSFSDVLPTVVPQLTDGIDFAWIDGHHEKEPTLRYFDALRPALNSGAVVLFDDISWSVDMRSAWAQLADTEGFSDTVDLGWMGLGIWGGEIRPRRWDMTALTGRPKVADPAGRDGWRTHSG